MSHVTPAQPFTLKARWVFPVDSSPINGGTITIAGERIVAVGKHQNDSTAIDLGDVALLPGLVNCHTHLEFSTLSAPLGTPGMAFAEWIQQVLTYRRDRADDLAAAIALGLREAAATGTTALGEIATMPWRFAPGRLTPDVTAFGESIGLADESIEDRLHAAREFLRSSDAVGHVRPALSPHAPYTVHREMLDGLVAISSRQRVPLAMHLAESREELQLLADHSGPLRDLLESRQVWNPAAIPRGARPLDYLQVLARADRALVIHGNYLADDELSLLAARADRMTLVFCPRTHAYFQHAPHPLPRLLAQGGSAAVGTDSRASNPDLNMWHELCFLARTMPRISPATVLKLGTLAGAMALGQEHEFGSLRSGKLANLVTISLTGSDTTDPHTSLFADDTKVSRAMIRGRWVSSQTT